MKSAFPNNVDGEDSGMDLRDWFAGRALSIYDQAMLQGARKVAEERNLTPALVIAGQVYEIADAMLKVRAK
jgi:hypothetical protein